MDDPTLETILKKWNTQEYDPPHTDVREWIHSVESRCNAYGIPDVQRPQCATYFIKKELRAELLLAFEEVKEKFGSVRWAQFKNFMAEFDKEFRKNLPFYKKHPKLILFIGIILLVSIIAMVALPLIGFTPAGVAAGSLAAIAQSIVYGGATGGIFSLLQAAGATMVFGKVLLVSFSLGSLFYGVHTYFKWYFSEGPAKN